MRGTLDDVATMFFDLYDVNGDDEVSTQAPNLGSLKRQDVLGIF